MENIIVRNLFKSFDDKIVLRDFNAVIKANEITGLMAPSGQGKTTFLRILLGLEKADSGHITGLRNIRFSAVFQENILCENLSVYANIKLINQKLIKNEIRENLREVNLDKEIDEKVVNLSGGMKRRVSILRALLAEYDFLCLDEPFVSMDEETKNRVIQYTKKACRNQTVLFISHDFHELEMMDVKNCLAI